MHYIENFNIDAMKGWVLLANQNLLLNRRKSEILKILEWKSEIIPFWNYPLLAISFKISSKHIYVLLKANLDSGNLSQEFPKNYVITKIDPIRAVFREYPDINSSDSFSHF